MRSRVLLLTFALVAAACGKPGPVAAPSTTITTAPSSTLAPPTTEAPTTTSTMATTTTLPPGSSQAETFREEWLIETNRGEITAQGEHAGDAHRWVEIYGSDPGSISREVISVGNEAWNRYPGEDWEPIGQNGVVTDLLNGHPFEVADVVRDFELVGPTLYEGRDVTTYAGDTRVVAVYSGIDPALIVDACAEVAIFPDDSFATYQLYYERDDGDWARLTYRTYDFGMPITIERPR